MALVFGNLIGANQPNRVCFYNPSKSVQIACVDTDNTGRFALILAPGAYSIRVNDFCWATAPEPLFVMGGGVRITVVAPSDCVNRSGPPVDWEWEFDVDSFSDPEALWQAYQSRLAEYD